MKESQHCLTLNQHNLISSALRKKGMLLTRPIRGINLGKRKKIRQGYGIIKIQASMNLFYLKNNEKLFHLYFLCFLYYHEFLLKN